MKEINQHFNQEDINYNINNNSILNKTFELNKHKNFLLKQESQTNTININNVDNDIKNHTLSLFGLKENNNMNDFNNNYSKQNIKQQMMTPQFELENIYRERLFSLYKDKSKEDLLNFFIESEVKNILLNQEIINERLNKTKLEHAIIDIQQENSLLKNKVKYLLNNNNYNQEYKRNVNTANTGERMKSEDSNLSLPNSSFIEKELNINSQYNNMDIDSLYIKNNK